MKEIRSFKGGLAFAFLLGVLSSLLLGFIRQQEKTPEPETPGDRRPAYALVLAGDSYFGERYFEKAAAEGKAHVLRSQGYDYPLVAFKDLLAESDAAVVNLAAALTQLRRSRLDPIKNYLHWSEPGKAAAALQGNHLDLFSLGNDHSMDYGIEGLKETMRTLDAHGGASFGAGLNLKQAMAAQPLESPDGNWRLALIGGHQYDPVYEMDYRFYATAQTGGVFPLKPESIERQLASTREAMPKALVIAFPHWGENYAWRTETQMKLAHQYIDQGASLVIGHGSHMMQEIEYYQGKWIIYGLGNFMYNSPGQYEAKYVPGYSLVARVECYASDDRGKWLDIKLYPILTNNRETGYQSRFLEGGAFEEAIQMLRGRSPSISAVKDLVDTGTDAVGSFLRLRQRVE